MPEVCAKDGYALEAIRQRVQESQAAAVQQRWRRARRRVAIAKDNAAMFSTAGVRSELPSVSDVVP